MKEMKRMWQTSNSKSFEVHTVFIFPNACHSWLDSHLSYITCDTTQPLDRTLYREKCVWELYQIAKAKWVFFCFWLETWFSRDEAVVYFSIQAQSWSEADDSWGQEITQAFRISILWGTTHSRRRGVGVTASERSDRLLSIDVSVAASELEGLCH